jgi:hypothetical protein
MQAFKYSRHRHFNIANDALRSGIRLTRLGSSGHPAVARRYPHPNARSAVDYFRQPIPQMRETSVQQEIRAQIKQAVSLWPLC